MVEERSEPNLAPRHRGAHHEHSTTIKCQESSESIKNCKCQKTGYLCKTCKDRGSLDKCGDCTCCTNCGGSQIGNSCNCCEVCGEPKDSCPGCCNACKEVQCECICSYAAVTVENTLAHANNIADKMKKVRNKMSAVKRADNSSVTAA